MANHTYQATALTANTTYCWKAQAIDPAGVNIFGAFSATSTFNTQTSSTPPEVHIKGNVNIGGNVEIKP